MSYYCLLLCCVVLCMCRYAFCVALTTSTVMSTTLVRYSTSLKTLILLNFRAAGGICRKHWINLRVELVINIKLNHAQILLVFVSLLYNNNFSIKYLHLKSHPFRNKRYGVYYLPIGWRIVIFHSVVSLLVSHNVGSHTAHIK